MPSTLLDKIWSAHEVAPGLIYIDLHLVHEVTSPQAFEGLRLAGRTVRRPDRTLATADHNVPTDGTPRAAAIIDELSRVQVQTLERNCAEFGVPVYSMGSDRQGIVHVIGPELGVTQPGMTIVCGDSHTATHGAFGALAFGIGTSEVEHVLATQCLVQTKPRSMRIRYEGERGFGVTAKDLILATIGQIGVDGAVGHVVEYAGPAISELSMEGRMTVCNMTIEGGGRAGMVAPDDVTFEWFERTERPGAGSGAALERAIEGWRELRSDADAPFDREVVVDVAAISPQVTWGTNPGMVVGVADSVPVTRRLRGRGRSRRGRAGAGLHGSRGRHADRRDPPRPRVHRLLHQLADRRPAGRRVGDPRAAASPGTSTRWSCRGSAAGQRAGRGRGPRRGLPRGRLRLAHRGLLDVPGNEPGHPCPR
jgi:3-isopropylmalate/(R)-2-methylmalate dehydratase large subunit